mgnify:CR=1
SGNFVLHLHYDDDLIGDLQVRELLGLGINIDLWVYLPRALSINQS